MYFLFLLVCILCLYGILLKYIFAIRDQFNDIQEDFEIAQNLVREVRIENRDLKNYCSDLSSDLDYVYVQLGKIILSHPQSETVEKK